MPTTIPTVSPTNSAAVTKPVADDLSSAAGKAAGNSAVERQLDDAVINQAVKIWNAYQAEGLRVRHEIGQLLNERLGSPEQRQPYGDRVVLRVSERLGIDRSTISRMRKFAHLYSDFEAFQESHPDVSSWDDVKRLITKSNEKMSQSKPARTVDGLASVQRVMQKFVKELSQSDITLTEEDREGLRASLEEVGATLSMLFGVAIRVEAGENEEKATALSLN